jgi:hypothetical protein
MKTLLIQQIVHFAVHLAAHLNTLMRLIGHLNN